MARNKMSDYSVEFNVEEVEKLKRIAQLLHASAGQNEEYQSLATWLTSVVNDDDDNDNEQDDSGEPKPKKAKIRKRK